MQNKQFDRSQPLGHRSLAGKRFRADMALVNNYYWISKLAEGGLSAELKKHDPGAEPSAALNLPSEFRGRVGHNIAKLTEGVPHAKKWRRLLCTIMISSAFERYVIAISRVAIESDPLLKPGFPKLVDGAQFLKHGVALPERNLKKLTQGEWPQRISAHASIFSVVPVELSGGVADLELLRKTRNSVAHTLGVNNNAEAEIRSGNFAVSLAIEAQRPDVFSPNQAAISESRLLKLMGSVQGVVDAIDAQMLRDHVGSYELLAVYLQWKKDPAKFEEAAGIKIVGHNRQQDNRFGNVAGGLFERGLGVQMLSEMEDYAKTL